MISLETYIDEALKISGKSKLRKQYPKPKDKYDIFNLACRIQNEGEKILDLSGLDVSGITDLSWAFNNLEFEEIHVYDWDVSECTNFHAIFSSCKNLKFVKGLETWDISSAKTFIGMFENSRRLKEVDLSGWKIVRDCAMEDMFRNCIMLKTIKGFENFDNYFIRNMRDCFYNCKRLKLNLSNWSSNIVNLIPQRNSSVILPNT